MYLIRHAESEGNANALWSGTDSALTDFGRLQSEAVARRLKTIPFDLTISSTLPRARETADIIATHTGKEIVSSDLFVECRKPYDQIGISRSDPRSVEMDREIVAHFAEPGWHLGDEENFEEMKTRGLAALAYLIARPEERILVVGHGYFMRVMLAVAIAGQDLTPEWCQHFLTSFRTGNTGISTLYFDEKEEHPWWLWSWNDHSHLGE